MASRTRRAAGTASEQHVHERHFADELGYFWESAGGTRMAGRVLGALLLADPPEMSSSELSAFLGVSSGSISTATRELVRPGLVQRVRVPGERQDYFRAAMGDSALPRFLQSRLALTRHLIELLRRGQRLAVRKDPQVRQQLAEMREFYEFIEQEQAAIFRKWERRTRGRAR